MLPWAVLLQASSISGPLRVDILGVPRFHVTRACGLRGRPAWHAQLRHTSIGVVCAVFSATLYVDVSLV